jgi:hypothetical protein
MIGLGFSTPNPGNASPTPVRSLTADQNTTNKDDFDPFTPGSNGKLLTNSWNEPDDESPGRNQLPGEYGPKTPDSGSWMLRENEPPADLSSLTREQLEQKVRAQEQEILLANAEAQFFHKRWEDLHLSNEALGQEALTGDEQALEDRLVEAVKEAYQTEMQRREANKILLKIVTLSHELLQTAPKFDPQVRAEYEVACRSARELLDGKGVAPIPLANSLTDARVVSIDLKLGAVILNVGKNLGTLDGFPFEVKDQTGKVIALVRVVYVRPSVCIANIERCDPKVNLKEGDIASVVAH